MLKLHLLSTSPARIFWIVFGLLGATTSPYACASKTDGKSTDANGGEAGTATAAGGRNAASGASGLGGGIALNSGGNAGVAGSGCGETALTATERPVYALILLDRSLSMTSSISSTDATTRWSALRTALNTAMSNVGKRVAFGLKLFPDGDASNECGVLGTNAEVPLGFGLPTLSAVDQAIAQALPNGGTPIGAALDWANAYFVSGPGKDVVGDRVVLLATDGAPNCNPDATCDKASCIANMDRPEEPNNLCSAVPTACLDGSNAQAKVSALLAQPNPVRTVVVGIPGSDSPAYAAILDSLGHLGGLPNPDPALEYFAVSAAEGAVGLTDTLSRITTQLIVSCKLELKSTPPDPTKLNVYVDGLVVPRDAENGWKLDATSNPPTVLLQGSTCSRLETTGAQSISIRYGCPTYVIL